MIERFNPSEDNYRVSYTYGVIGGDKARVLHQLLTYLSLLAHGPELADEDPRLVEQLRERYGFDVEAATADDYQRVYQRVTEECITLVQALGGLGQAQSLPRGLDIPSVFELRPRP